MVKFLDLCVANQHYENELKQAFSDFLASGRYILGNQVSKFENNFASYCGTSYCIGVSNGLDALHLIFEAYKLLGIIENGDEVIVPANTYIASILAIGHAQLKPILVEPKSETYNIDPTAIENAITSKTKAVLGVHLYGQLYEVDTLEQLCTKHGLLLIEDAAQAHGAMHKDGRKAGNVSNAAAFSFYPTKNLGALGDAGAITTNNIELAKIVQKLRNYGRSSQYENQYKGYNCRLDELQAAFLNVKLKYLDTENENRRNLAKYYLEHLTNDKLTLPNWDGSKNHVFHQFVVLVKERDRFVNYMNDNGVELGLHYPIAPHKQNAFLQLNTKNLPITEQIHAHCCSLPISNVIAQDTMSKIVKIIDMFN